MTSKIKEAIFYIFGESKLPQISANAMPAVINKWKKSTNVKKCYDLLYKPISDIDATTHIMKIVERIFENTSETTDVQVAYVMCVCDFFLNPENDSIQITESMIKNKLEESLVSFTILYNLMLLDFTFFL